ncbi:MAG TPA: ATP-binding protein [Spirochaetia bacterium]|nr:ATP-binding protein [Spirochaetia bacterium]
MPHRPNFLRLLFPALLGLFALTAGLVLISQQLRASARNVEHLAKSASRAAALLSDTLSTLPNTNGNKNEAADRKLNAALKSIADNSSVLIAVIERHSRQISGSSAPISTSFVSAVLGLDPASDKATLSGFVQANGIRYVVAVTAAGSDGTDRKLLAVAAIPVGRFPSSVLAFLLFTLSTFLGISGVAVLVRFIRRSILQPIERLAQDTVRYSREGSTGEAFHAETPGLESLTAGLNAIASTMSQKITTLTRERNELQTIHSSMVEGIILLDSELRIRSMNRAASRMFQRPYVEANGKSLLDYCRNTGLSDLAERAMRSRTPVEETIALYQSSIQYVQVNGVSLALSEPPGEGILLVLNDITRQKQTDEIRKDFVSNVSHELRTPITSIKGFVETLLDGAIDDPQNARRFLSIILNQSNRINFIIEDLLSLSRLEQNDAPIKIQIVDIRNVVHSSLESCEQAAAAKTIRLDHHISGDFSIECNPSLLEQALTNLVENAIKYSPPGSRVHLGVESASDSVSICVRDNGTGIPAKDLPRIFERFYRVDRARARDVGGTGLGLSIVKHIALAHHGEVFVTSELGSGSEFTLRIPRTQTR